MRKELCSPNRGSLLCQDNIFHGMELLVFAAVFFELDIVHDTLGIPGIFCSLLVNIFMRDCLVSCGCFDPEFLRCKRHAAGQLFGVFRCMYVMFA